MIYNTSISALLVSVILIFSGCNQAGSPPAVFESTPEATALSFYRAIWSGEEPRNFYYSDEDYFVRKHGAEMLRTLEVVDVAHLPPRAAVFVRYSVGTRVFRDAQVMRQVDDKWAITNDYKVFFSERDTSWQEDPASLLDKRVYDWKQESPSYFELVHPGRY